MHIRKPKIPLIILQDSNGIWHLNRTIYTNNPDDMEVCRKAGIPLYNIPKRDD